jgi:hypothetical protein
MSNQELLDALMAREIAPRVIVGTGYKNGRQVAIDYLKSEITNEKEEKQMIELTKCKTCDEQINPAEHEGCNYCDECCHELQMSWQVR